MQSTVIDYTVALPNGSSFSGRDAYISVGRYVGVVSCSGPGGQEAALVPSCASYAQVFGGKLGSLFDRYG